MPLRRNRFPSAGVLGSPLPELAPNPFGKRVEWRLLRDASPSKASWKARRLHFLRSLLPCCHLPVKRDVFSNTLPFAPSASPVLPPKPPPLILHDDDRPILLSKRVCRFIVDNQALAFMLEGRTPLKDEVYFSSFRIMASNLDSILQNCFTPLSLSSLLAL